jgi:butyryl-CoA dehydrogenase
MASDNPLIRDRFVDFLLHDVLDVTALTRCPHFAEHERETFDLYVAACRRLARTRLFPTYRAMDEQPPRLESGRVIVHAEVKRLFRELVDLGAVNATRRCSQISRRRRPWQVWRQRRSRPHARRSTGSSCSPARSHSAASRATSRA